MTNDDSLKKLLKMTGLQIFWGVKQGYPKHKWWCRVYPSGAAPWEGRTFCHSKRTDCVREAIAYLGAIVSI